MQSLMELHAIQMLQIYLFWLIHPGLSPLHISTVSICFTASYGPWQPPQAIAMQGKIWNSSTSMFVLDNKELMSQMVIRSFAYWCIWYMLVVWESIVVLGSDSHSCNRISYWENYCIKLAWKLQVKKNKKKPNDIKWFSHYECIVNGCKNKLISVKFSTED